MVISLRGEWDISNRNALSARLEPAFGTEDAILDLSGMTFVSSTFLNALLAVHHYRKTHGLPAATLITDFAFVRKVLELARFDELFLLA